MQKFLFIVWLSIGISAEGVARTQFFFDYSFGVDQFCLSSAQASFHSLPSSGPANQEIFRDWISQSGAWTNEALQWSPRFQESWQRHGSVLMEETQRILGESIDRQELGISLFLCLNRNSMGAPLSINVPYYLPTPAKAYQDNPWWKAQLEKEDVELPLPLSAFVEMTFHEVLHILVMQIFKDRESALLQTKYSKESQTVKSHLHVFALEKEVYRRLAVKFPQNEFFQSKVLSLSKRFFRVTKAVGYTRAWEIVDRDGAEPLIEELTQTPTDSTLCPWCQDGHWRSIEWLLKLLQ